MTLTELREKYGLSMSKIGKKAGVTPGTVWQWERKDPSELKPKVINALRKVFPEAEITLMLDPNADVTGQSFDMPVSEEEPIEQPALIDEEPEPEPEAEPDEIFKNLREVYSLLSDSGKQQLVSYARYLFMVDKGVNFNATK